MTATAFAYTAVMRDRFLQLFALGFVAVTIPYLVPGVSSQLLARIEQLQTVIFMIPATMLAFQFGLRRSGRKAERRFWDFLTIAFGAWWIIKAEMAFLSVQLWAIQLELVLDLFYALFYVCWFLALECRPHRKWPSGFSRRESLLRAAGLLVFVFGSWFYFVGVPYHFAWEYNTALAPTLYLFVGFDLVLMVLAVRRARIVPQQSWRWTYGFLGASAGLFAVGDLLEALIYQEIVPWPWANHLDFLWNLPILVVVVAARVRLGVETNSELSVPESATEFALNRWTNISPTVLFAFALPILHLGLEQLNLIDEVTRSERQLVALLATLALGILALSETRGLQRQVEKSATQKNELEEMRIAKEVAERASDDKSRFLATVSHEIRTPISGIIGMSDLLLDGELPKEEHAKVRLLKESADGLLQIIDDILGFSKAEAGEMIVNRRPFSLRETVESVMNLEREAASGKNLRLEFVLEKDVPDQVVGDSSRLRQILLNLVANAIKFSDQGLIQISARPSSTQAENGGISGGSSRVRFEVRDSGRGIKEESLERIFEPFIQGDGSASRVAGGIGLGLAICQRIVAAFDGEIGVESKVGHGATFWFELDFGRANQPSSEWDNKEFATQRVAGFRPAGSDPFRILLAEDNPVNQIVALHQLKKLGYRVEVAANGSEALAALAEQQFDLVLMDCQMPIIDGLEATRRYRAIEKEGERIPIVAVTAHALVKDRERCLEAGMDDYLAKPYREEVLATTLERWLLGEAPDPF